VNWENSIDVVPLTDVGLRRATNQDSYASAPALSAESWNARGHLFVVADGMGAHAAGELASKMAVETIPHIYAKLVADNPAPAAILAAVKEANREIHSRGKANAEFEGMGTTTSVLILLPQGALVAHVGDSRVYRQRGQELEQLSFDHSLVWELQARSQHSEEQIAEHVPKNIITRSLGPSPEVQVDLEGPYPIQTGDTFLLCSDGLSGQVADDEIGVILGTLPPEEAARTLVDLANLRGGPDNITIIVVRVNGPNIPNQNVIPLPAPKLAQGPVKPLDSTAWLVMGAFGSLAAVMLLLEHWIFAGIFLLGLGAALAFFFRQRLFGETSEWQSATGMLGRGPHRRYQCPVDAKMADRLGQLIREVRDAATAEDWAIDWFQFNGRCEKAVNAMEREEFGQAIREYCLAISFMMSELRNQRKKKQKK